MRFRHLSNTWLLALLMTAHAVAVSRAQAQNASAQNATAQNASARSDATGWRFHVEIRGSSTSTTGAVTVDSVIAGRGVVRGLDARFDIEQSHDADLHVGGWVLTADGGRTLLTIDPVTRRFSMIQNAAMLRQFAESKWISMRVSRLTTRGDSLGPCGQVDGHATSCFRFVREYTVRVRYFLIAQVLVVREDVQFWVADDLPGLVNPAATFLTDVASLATDDPSALLHAQQTLSRLYRGVPIKLVRTDTQWESADKRGPTSVSTTTLLLRDIAPTAINDTLFALPAHFRVRGR